MSPGGDWSVADNVQEVASIREAHLDDRASFGVGAGGNRDWRVDRPPRVTQLRMPGWGTDL